MIFTNKQVRMMATQRSRISSSVAAVAALFYIQSDEPDLLHARVQALSKQIPLLFFIAIVNTLAVSYTYYGVAPNSMTVAFPLVMTVGYIGRGIVWIRAGYRPPGDADARHLLKMTIILAPVASAIVFVWAIALYRYGGAYAQGHVVFYMGVTMICCIFCQMHLRPAALLMSGIIAIPFTIFLLATGRPVFAAIALSMLLVSIAMVYILLVTSRDFTKMIEYQRGLVESQIENLRLANTDSLTALPNRRKFISALEECLARATRDTKCLVVGLRCSFRRP
jgi:predicted signal transduction protein with EAL and GGDEF domain